MRVVRVADDRCCLRSRRAPGAPVLAGSTKNATKTNSVIAKNRATDESSRTMTNRAIAEA